MLIFKPCYYLDYYYALFSYMTSLEEGIPRSQMICMLAIPAWLSCHDLLNFLAPCCPGIRKVRIIRDSTPNQYMALVLFRSQVTIV